MILSIMEDLLEENHFLYRIQSLIYYLGDDC